LDPFGATVPRRACIYRPTIVIAPLELRCTALDARRIAVVAIVALAVERTSPELLFGLSIWMTQRVVAHGCLSHSTTLGAHAA